MASDNLITTTATALDDDQLYAAISRTLMHSGCRTGSQRTDAPSLFTLVKELATRTAKPDEPVSLVIAEILAQLADTVDDLQ